MKETNKVVLALGANIGDRPAALRAAVRGLADYVTITAKSPIYETAPAYIADQPKFLNAAVIGKTKLEPLALLRAIKNLESDLGRQPTFHYGPRAIDIDVIFYGNEIIDRLELTVPHPRLAEREFVLRPLVDIAPDWRHPQNGLTAAEMLTRLTETSAKKLAEML
jgi:2-amino-4-hydroxy-6-hydroxymethyldihydropteridine diphosphokinase